MQFHVKNLEILSSNNFELISEAMFQINQSVTIFKLTSRYVLFIGIIHKNVCLGFQYKVLHLLTEIKDGIDSVANLLKADNTSFRLTQYDNLDEFCEFDRSLTDKTTERSVVSLHTFLLKLDLK